MKPSQVATSLRHIAATIDNSKQPDRALVAKALTRVLATVQLAADAAKSADISVIQPHGKDYREIQILRDDGMKLFGKVDESGRVTTTRWELDSKGTTTQPGKESDKLLEGTLKYFEEKSKDGNPITVDWSEFLSAIDFE